MDETAAMDQIKAEIQNGSPESRADLSLKLFEAAISMGASTDVLIGAGVTAIAARQAVIIDRLTRIEAKLDGTD